MELGPVLDNSIAWGGLCSQQYQLEVPACQWLRGASAGKQLPSSDNCPTSDNCPLLTTHMVCSAALRCVSCAVLRFAELCWTKANVQHQESEQPMSLP